MMVMDEFEQDFDPASLRKLADFLALQTIRDTANKMKALKDKLKPSELKHLALEQANSKK